MGLILSSWPALWLSFVRPTTYSTRWLPLLVLHRNRDSLPFYVKGDENGASHAFDLKWERFVDTLENPFDSRQKLQGQFNQRKEWYAGEDW